MLHYLEYECCCTLCFVNVLNHYGIHYFIEWTEMSKTSMTPKCIFKYCKIEQSILYCSFLLRTKILAFREMTKACKYNAT